MRVRIPNVEYELAPDEVAILCDELDKLERPGATSVAATLRNPPTPYEPSREDVVELARALDHLRNLGALPKDRDGVFGPMALRDNLVARFDTHRYLLDPLTSLPPIATMAWGPLHQEGDRLVDTMGDEWVVRRIEADSEPIGMTVDPWRPRAARF